MYENQELVIDYVPYDDNPLDTITKKILLNQCTGQTDADWGKVGGLLESTSDFLPFTEQNYTAFNPSSAWVGLSLCTTLTLFDGFVYSDYKFEFEIRGEDY